MSVPYRPDPTTGPPAVRPAPSGARIARGIWFAILALAFVNFVASMVQADHPNFLTSGGIPALLAAGGVNGAVRLCKGERSGRTLAVTLGAVQAVIALGAAALLLSVGAEAGVDDASLTVVVLFAVVVVGLIIAASVLMFRRDVQEFLART